MFTVEQAVRIALLENTGLDEVAIKSVVAAVVEMTVPEGEPDAWIIERPDSLPTITHYRTVADAQRSMGRTVVDYYSRGA